MPRTASFLGYLPGNPGCVVSGIHVEVYEVAAGAREACKVSQSVARED
jgi:hypothetical protein